MVNEDDPTNQDEEISENGDHDSIKFVINLIAKNDIEELKRCLESNTEENAMVNKEDINSPCYGDKTLLDIVAMFKANAFYQELLKHSTIPVQDIKSPSGYTPLHKAASVGNLELLMFLVTSGCDVGNLTNHGETAQQIALRYQNVDCSDFLNVVAARHSLEKFIAEVKDKISDPEKMQGVKLSKEEKSMTTNACSEKLEWIDNNQEASVEEFLLQRNDLENKIEPVMSKEPVSL